MKRVKRIKQCALLQVPRSSLYYALQGETEQNLALMRLIDVQFLDTPFFGVRQMNTCATMAMR
jgi:putative transposase